MGIGGIANILEHALLYWLVVLGILVLYRCATGGINLSGVLAQDERRSTLGAPAPERVQLIAAFFFAVIAYARLALVKTQGIHGAPATSLPEAPKELIALFVASHAIYLTGKFGRARKDKGESQ
jgi:hypothetical protein